MIYKWIIKNKSIFSESIIDTLYDEIQNDLIIKGLLEEDYLKIFNQRHIKNLSKKSELYCLYIDDVSRVIKAFIVKYKGADDEYYGFTNTNNELSFKFNPKDGKEVIAGKLEKTLEKKFKFKIIEKSQIDKIKNIRYVEYFNRVKLYEGDSKLILTRYDFHQGMMFSSDIIQAISHKEITVNNIQEIENKDYLSLDKMQQRRNKRNDYFFIDKDKHTLKYFIYSYYSLIPHYMLFVNDGDHYSFRFIKESISANKLLNIIYSSFGFREIDEVENNALGKTHYFDFIKDEDTEAIIKEIEIINEKADEELENSSDKVINSIQDINPDLKEFMEYINNLGGVINEGEIYFPEEEDFAFASIGKYEIKIRTSRFPKDEYLKPFPIKSIKSQDKIIKNLLYRMLQQEHSSRLHIISTLINQIEANKYLPNEYNNYTLALAFESLWGSDINRYEDLINELFSKYKNWRNDNKLSTINFEVTPEKDIEEVNEVEEEINKTNKTLYLLGSISNINAVRDVAGRFGFNKRKINIYPFEKIKNGFDITKLKNQNQIDNSLVIFGQIPHSVSFKGKASSIIDLMEEEKENFPPFKVCKISYSPACINKSRLEKALNEFKEESLL